MNKIDKFDVRFKNDTALLLESVRLKSFDKWPNDRSWKCTPEKFAKSGFFFSPSRGSPDNVCCAFCQLELDCWEPNDDPLEEHKKRSEQCPFITTNCPVESLSALQFIRLVEDIAVFRARRYLDKAKAVFEKQAEETREEIVRSLSQ